MKKFQCAILLSLAMFFALAQNCSAALIINHTAIDEFPNIPDQYINVVKQMIAQYIGASHSTQMAIGLQLLAQQNPKYAVQTGYSPTQLTNTLALRMLRGKLNQYNKWSEYSDDDEYWSATAGQAATVRTAQYFVSQSTPLKVSIFGWCWDICNPAHFSLGVPFNDDHFNLYMNTIKSFNDNSAINQTKFVYNTGVSDCSASITDGRWRVTRYNDLMRQWVIQNNAILFDQADIENWNKTNTAQYITTDPQGRTVYPRHANYDESVLPDSQTGDHANDECDIRKAKAMWVLLAKLAGWNGSGAQTCPLQGDVTCDQTVNSTDIQTAINIFLGINTNADQIIRADLNGDSKVNVSDIQKIINIVLGL